MALIAAVVVGAGVVPALVSPRAPRAGADTLTMSADTARSSWYPDEAALAPSTVNATTAGGTHFGQLFATQVDGQVYAQPLVSQGTLLAVTENNTAYGLDPVTGLEKWHHHFGPAWDPTAVSCGDLTPQIGMTATPVIDPATDIAYFTSKVATGPAGNRSSSSAWKLHALDVATGAEQPNFPVTIQGNATNDAGTTFGPQTQMQRTGLALLNGVVYMGFGSHCDVAPYLGWVVGVSTTTHTITSMWADETNQGSGGGAGIWQAGAAPIIHGTHLYYVTGNGTSPPAGPALGQPQPNGLGECVVSLDTATGGDAGQLSASDWFCPSDADQLNGFDGDFGSGGPTELPASFQTAADNFPMLVVAGKSGAVFILKMDDLGGRGTGPGGTDRVVSELGPYGGVWSKPAVWPGNGGYVYIPTASPGASGGGSSGTFNVFQRSVDGSGNLSLSLVATAPGAFGFSSSSPVVTSDGTTAGSAVVWIVHADDSSGVGAELRAYQAVPQDGSLPLLFSTALGSPGTSSKFNPPAVDGGRVYVGTRDGRVMGFGALAGSPKLSANAVNFAPTSLGSSADATATLDVTGSITVNSISIDNTAEFTAGTPTPTLPASGLSAGQQITVPLTFAPTNTGARTALLTVNTSAGAVDVPLDGTGLSASIPVGSSPSALDYGTLPIGGSPATSTVTFRNNSASAVTITGLVDPGGPFAVTDAPATDGTESILPGDSVGLHVTFTPPATSGNVVQTFDAQLTLQTDAGDALVPITGRAAPPAQISITPTHLDFGYVALHQSVTKTFTVANNGGVPLSILKSKPPASGVFAATSPLAEGTVIQPGAHVNVKVRFRPSAYGGAHDMWVINGNDDTGIIDVTFSGRGARYGTVPRPTATGWRINGYARMNGTALRLTPAATARRGTAFWPNALASGHLHVSFDETSSGGTGGNGLTLAFADASKVTPAALGSGGPMLGFGRIPGVAIGLQTTPSSTNSSTNSIGLVTGVSGTGLRWTATDAAIPALRAGKHLITVDAISGVVTVTVDGLLAFQSSVTLPPLVYLGFTGGTGTLTDVHEVSSVQISTGPIAG